MEYIKYAFTGVNILSSSLILIIIFYWIMTIIGFFSVDSFNIDFGVDVDLDIDVDVDLDANIDTGNAELNDVSIFVKFLNFSNIGVIPFMTYLSIFSLVLWTLSMLTYYTKIYPNSLVGFLIFFISFILSIFITKLITTPLVPLFKKVEMKEDISVLGNLCTLKSDIDETIIGIAELDIKDVEIIINVKSLNGSIKKGEKAIIVSKDEEKNVYSIEKNIYF